MRTRLLILALLLSAPLLRAQGSGAYTYTTREPDCSFSATLTAAGRSGGPVVSGNPAGYDNRNQGCVTWSVMYLANGFSALSLEIDTAPDANGIPGSWSVCANTGLSTLPLTDTQGDQASCFGFFPWISINLNSKTGTGSVAARVVGWRAGPGQDAAATSASGGGGGVTGLTAVNPNPPTLNGIFYGNGTTTAQVTAAGGAGLQCLQETAGAAPVFGACGGATSVTAASVLADTGVVLGSGGARGVATATGFTFVTPTLSLPASGVIQSADTGTPAITWSTNSLSINQPLNVAVSGASSVISFTAKTGGGVAPLGVADGMATNPAQINLPTATGSAGAFLQTNGASPQQSSWTFPSLDQITGSAAQATATETAISHEFTYAGVETANLTYPIVFKNTGSGTNTSGAVGIETLTGTAQVPLLINAKAASSGDIFQVWTGANGFTNGVFDGTSGTDQFRIASSGSVTLAAANAILTNGSGTGTPLVAPSTNTSSNGTFSIKGGTGNGTTATNTGQALTVSGGDETGATANAVIGGLLKLKGGDITVGTGTGSTAGGVTVVGGACTAVASASVCNGTVKFLQPFFTTGTATVHSLACVTATNTVATCSSAANGTNAIGWIDSVSTNTVYVQMGAFGQVVTGLALSATFTAGQWACADLATTAGDMVPSATKCAAGLPGGVVLTTATTTNPVFISSQTL